MITIHSDIDRIEAAANRQFREVAKMIPHEEDVSKMETTTPTSEESSQVGNAEKMLEALQKIVLLTVKAGMSIRFEVACGIISSTARCALSAPPRNCDSFSKAKVLEMLEDRSFSKEDTIEWLFAEAKGETDGSK